MTSTAPSGLGPTARARRQQAHLRSMQLALSALAALTVLFVSVGASPGPGEWSWNRLAEPYEGKVPIWLLAAFAAYASGALFWAHVVLLLDRVGATRWRRRESLGRVLRRSLLIVMLVGMPLVFAGVRGALLEAPETRIGTFRTDAQGPIELRIAIPADVLLGSTSDVEGPRAGTSASHYPIASALDEGALAQLAARLGVASELEATPENMAPGAGKRWIELVAEPARAGNAGWPAPAGRVQLVLSLGQSLTTDSHALPDGNTAQVRVTRSGLHFGPDFPATPAQVLGVQADADVSWGQLVRALERLRLRGFESFRLHGAGALVSGSATD